MSYTSLSSPRRKRLSSGQPGLSPQQSATSALRAPFLIMFTLFMGVWLIGPDQIDHAMSRVLPGAGKTGTEGDSAWRNAVSVMASEDGDTDPGTRSSSVASGTTFQQTGTIASGSTGQTVVTRGHDIVEMQPQTTITVDESTPDNSSIIVRLINGRIFVEAAKRKKDQTFSVETRYLVATVKGTKFDVTITQHGAAVAVSEGVVAVRPIGSSDSIDLTPGNTAVVSAHGTAVPIVGPTPPGGGEAAIEAARAHPASKMPSSVTNGDRI
jgi:FecR protein